MIDKYKIINNNAICIKDEGVTLLMEGSEVYISKEADKEIEHLKAVIVGKDHYQEDTFNKNIKLRQLLSDKEDECNALEYENGTLQCAVNDLKKQIDDMKCCGNCNEYYSAVCKNKESCSGELVCDKWKMNCLTKEQRMASYD